MIYLILVFFSAIFMWIGSWVTWKLIPRYAAELPAPLPKWINSVLPLIQFGLLLFIIGALALTDISTEDEIFAYFAGGVLALSFVLQDYLSNLFAGLITFYERPYEIGDWIEVSGIYGEVMSIKFRAIQVLTPDDTLVTISHNQILGQPLLNNNNGERDHLCVANFYLHPDHDAELVQTHLKDVALTSQYTQLEKPIAVAVQEKPWGTHYRVKAYPVNGRDQFLFISDLTVRGKAVLRHLDVKWANVTRAVS
ncbi:MAG: mechanosensitive ion channel domain-containing protein [Chloroflexota bacterium]